MTLTATGGSVAVGGIGSGSAVAVTTRGGDSAAGHGGNAGTITLGGKQVLAADLVARGGDTMAATAGFGGAAAAITLTASATSGDAVVLYGNPTTPGIGTLVARGGLVGVTTLSTGAAPPVGGTLDGNGANVTIQGAGAPGAALAGTSDIRLASSVVAAGGGSTIAVTTAGGSADGAISLLGPIVGTAPSIESLSLVAPRGTVLLSGAIGSAATPLADVAIVSGSALTLPSAFAKDLVRHHWRRDHPGRRHRAGDDRRPVAHDEGGTIALGTVSLASDATLSTVGGGAAGADVSIGSLDGLKTLTIADGTGNTTIGPIGATTMVAKIVLQGGGAETLAVRRLMQLDLGSKPGGSVAVNGPITKLGNVVTSGAAYSVSFTGGGFIGDPTFSNTGGVGFNGGYTISDGLTSISSTTTLSGSINAGGSSVSLGNVILAGPMTINAGSYSQIGTVTGIGSLTVNLPVVPISPPAPFVPPPPPPPSNTPPSDPGSSGGTPPANPSPSNTPPANTGDTTGGLGGLNPQAGGGPGEGGLTDNAPPAGYDGTADTIGQSAAYTPPSGGGGSGGSGSGSGSGSGTKQQGPVAVIPGLLQIAAPAGPSGGGNNNGGGSDGNEPLSADPGGWSQ